ncbi:MAG: YHS domain-containing protein [Nitrospiraceae bacterium]|nr:MAG: YHS domain-containing protein [Nitrospiraceae bacterium]
MWRIIILGVLLVIVYFMAKSALRGLFGKDKEVARSVGSPGSPSDMVQDPVCGMFVPKEGSFFLQQGDRTYFFCSETCRAGYQKKISAS